MYGSPRGVSVSVKILFSRFNASHGLVLVSAYSNLFIPIFQCDLGGFFGLGGLDFWWDLLICGFVLVATFILPEIGLCISLVWSCSWCYCWEFHEVGCCMA